MLIDQQSFLEVLLQILGYCDSHVFNESRLEVVDHLRVSQKRDKHLFNAYLFFAGLTHNWVTFLHKYIIVHFLLPSLFYVLNQIVDQFGLVLVQPFEAFSGFFKKRPKNVENVWLNYGIADAKGRNCLLKVGADDHEEIDDVRMSAGMPIGLLWIISQKSDDELVGNLEKLSDIRLVRVFN